MTTFPEALDAALAARYPVRGIVRPVAHRQGLTARMGAMERAYGGKAAAAHAAGIAPRTWRDWQRGSHKPSSANTAKLERAYRATLGRSPAARRSAARTGTVPAGMEIRAVVACLSVTPAPAKRKKSNRYNSTPHRTFRADRWNLHLGAMVRAWAAGKTAEEVAKEARAAIHSAYAKPFDFEGDDVSVTLTD